MVRVWKNRSIVGSLAAIIAAGALVAGAFAEKEKPATAAPTRTEKPRVIILNPEEGLASIMPGPEHERLMKLVGEWEILITVESAGAPPAEAQSTATITSAIDGRFLHESGQGDVGGFDTQHFRTLGYNNGSKKYEAVWSWTMSTGFLYLSGQSTDEGRSIEWEAWHDNERGERQELSARHTFIDDNHFTVELCAAAAPEGGADAQPGPRMVMSYARKLSSATPAGEADPAQPAAP
jgi:hypothetical protein